MRRVKKQTNKGNEQKETENEKETKSQYLRLVIELKAKHL